jgi:hypothetical protein
MSSLISKGADAGISSIEHQSLLYDFYGGLLSEKQAEVMSLYHEDNLSLSEIAEDLGMTRQAVHYTLKKAEAALEGYESKLGLISRYRRNQELAREASGIITGLDLSGSVRQRITDIIEEITES